VGLSISVENAFSIRAGKVKPPRIVSSRPHVATLAFPRSYHAEDVKTSAGLLLDKAILSPEPVKLVDVAIELSVSTGFLRYWHPRKVAALRDVNLAREQRIRVARRLRHQVDVMNVVDALLLQGQVPGRKRVEIDVRKLGVSLIEPSNFTAFKSSVKALSRSDGLMSEQ
jgi:hypothetical protein